METTASRAEIDPAATMASNFNVTPLAQQADAGAERDYAWVFEADNDDPGVNAIMTIPLLWSAPQSTNSAGAGYVQITSGSCPVTLSSITGRTIIVNQPASPGCLDGQTFTIHYKKATAPNILGNYTFDSDVVTADPVVTVVTGTTTDLQSSDATSDYLDMVTFTATISPNPGGGSVSFYDSGSSCSSPGTLIGTDAVDAGGQADVSTATLSGGSHTILACFGGFLTFGVSEDSLSQSVVTINQATLTVVPTPSTVVYGNTATLSTTGGSGTGAVTFSSGLSTGCSVSGTTLSVDDASGSCSITATKAADNNYNSATSAPLTVTLQAANQATLTAVSTPSTVVYGNTATLSTTGGSGTGAVTFSSGLSTGCSVSGTTLSVDDASGSCSITATKAADNNYNSATSAPLTVTLQAANQATLTAVSTPSTVVYGNTATLSTTGGSGTGAVTFSSGLSTGCSVSGTTLSVDDASGSCSITATKAADNNYNSATSAPLTVTLQAANQATLTAVSTPSTVVYGNTATLSTTGGSGTGAVTFSSGLSTGCSVSGTTLSVDDASGSCSITATKAADNNYNSATSAPLTVTLQAANQATLTAVSTPSTVVYGNTATLSTTGGSGTGAVTFSSGLSTGCSVSGTTLSVDDASGSCWIMATKAADNNYNSATSAPLTVTLQAATQATLTAVSTPSTVVYGSTATLSTTGGSGTGAVTFSSGLSTGCSVSGTTLSVDDASGSCSITATKAADNNYNSATSAPLTVTLQAATQATLTAVSTPSTVVYGSTATLSTTGGSGTGAVTFSSGLSTGCSVSGTTLSVDDASGSCSITATKAADNNYNSATSAPLTVTLQAATQATLTAVSTPSTVVYGSTATLSTTGGSGTGAVTFSSGLSTGCSVSGTTLSVDDASGSCSITATKAADNNYNSATSAPLTVTLQAANQSITFASIANRTFGDPDFTITLPTSDSGLPVGVVSDTPTICTLSGNTVHLVFPGTCSLTASQSGNSNYNAANPQTRTFLVNFCPTVSIPTNLSGGIGQTVTIPVNTTDLSPSLDASVVPAPGILSAQFTMTYNPAVLSPNPADISVALGVVDAGSNTPIVNTSTPGTIVVSINSSSAFASAPGTADDSGSIALITMKVIGSVNTIANPDTTLTLSNFAYNQPIPDAICETTTNGAFDVSVTSTSTTVISSSATSIYGNLVTFTATVSPIPTAPRGTVDFSITNDSGETLCTGVAVDSLGKATCQRSLLSVANSSHAVSATYVPDPGNPNFSGSSSTPILQTITPKNVSVTAQDKSKSYGDADPGFTYTVATLVSPDTSLAGVSCNVVPAHVNVGTYPITCSGNTNTNYNVTAYNAGTLTIDPKDVTVTAEDKSKTYGDADPAFTYTVATLVSPDTSLAGVSCGVSVTHVNVGTYPITCSGNTNTNYNVTAYNAGTLTIDPKDVTVTAEDKSKTYGDADPAFTYTVATLVLGDTSLAGVSCNVVPAHVNAGAYTITCSGNTDPNYNVKTYNPGTLTIGTFSLTISADSGSKYYGLVFTFASPGFTTTPASLPNGDTVTSVTLTSAGQPANAPVVLGGYSIVPSSPVFSPAATATNYNVTYANGTLTVNQAQITRTGGSGQANYDTTAKTPSPCSVTVQNGALVPADNVGCNNVPPTVGPTPGAYTINSALTGTNLSNYADTAVAGSYTIHSSTISGSVTYAHEPAPVPTGSPTPTPIPVPGVTLSAPDSHSPTAFPTITGTTDSSGGYFMSMFSPLPAPSTTFFGEGTYTVTPSKPKQGCSPTNVTNGIFADDASKVSQHVVGLITLSAPGQAAAKVSGSPTISSFDAALIARKVVGLCSAPVNASGEWRFTSTSKTYTFAPLTTTNLSGENYTAIMMGDVNGDWSPAGPNRPAVVDPETAPRVSAGSVSGLPGSMNVVPVRIDNLNGATVGSYQFDVEYDPAVVDPDQIAADLNGTLGVNLNVVHNVVEPGLLKVAVYGAMPASGDGVYLNLRFRASGNLGAMSAIRIREFRFNDGSVGVVTQDGSISIGAAEVSSIRGRVLTPSGQGLRNAQVFLTNAAGERTAVTTSSFGRFEFTSLTIGQTYTVTVGSKRYRFAPQIVTVSQSLAEIDLTALE
ncbi:MAG: MBG domain-containing protein [Pyrinomonadaceae bacterium]